MVQQGEMKKRSLAIALSLFLLSVVSVSVYGAKNQSSQKHPTINTSKWVSVSLPFRPYNITAVNGALWVCGLNETIAVSNDKGVSWHFQHQKQGGEVLLKIAFVDEKTGHAAGTGGLILSTTDGGQTWSSHASGSTIGDFSFSGPGNGIAEIGGQVNLTSDGGEHWQEVSAMRTDPKVKPFSQIESVAALSTTHLAVALHQDQGENIILSTTDGGKTWIPTHIANTFAGTLLPHNGEYWAFGIEYLGREHDPGGGYSAAVVLHSREGQNWEHGVRPSSEFDGCTSQACYLHYGVLEVLYGKSEAIWSLPQDSATTGKWAMVEDTICTVGTELKCGKAIPSDTPQPLPNTGPIQIQLRRSEPLVEGCLDCQFTQVPAPASLAGKPAVIKDVFATFTVSRSGSVESVGVKGAPSKALNDAIALQISNWLITPSHQDGVTIPDTKSLELNILCSPRFPGLTENPSCNVVAASSFSKLR
jgi:photosystem II stability/assembly factor-like uncharacterized protein